MKVVFEERLKQKLRDASFRAYSNITADEQQLHGNVKTVVNLSVAIAISEDLARKLDKIKKLLKTRPPTPIGLSGDKQVMIQYSDLIEKLLNSLERELES